MNQLFYMRRRKPGRTQDIAEAALTVFIRQGFRLTQMADVAREAGISAGSLYTYVDSKEALLEIALLQGLGELAEHNEPYRASGLTKTSSSLAAKLAKSFRWPILEKALRQDRIAPDLLGAIVDEHFTLFSKHRRLIWLLDRCAAEVAELSGFYQASVRGPCIANFTRAIRLCMGAQFSEEEVAARGRALFEMIVWMAMHRHRDRLPPATSDEAARRATIEIVFLAVQPPKASTRKSKA
jgi:AcrR family transcriptional regulator